MESDGLASGMRLSYENSNGSRTIHALSSSYLSTEQRRRNEIVVHGAAKVSYDKSYDARSNFVHFAQHSMRNFMQGQGSVRRFSNIDTWYDSEKVVEARRFLRSSPFWLVTTVCSFVALVSPDICVLCQVPSNIELDTTLTVILLVFFVEFVGLSTAEMSYPLSFFFWMDLCSTVSMVFDISYLFGPDATQPRDISQDMFIVRASRAGRFGGRVGRLSRALKFLKLLLICGADEKRDKGRMARAISNQLSAIISTRVAFLTIFVAISLPMFAMFDYPTVDESLSAWAKMLAATAAEAALNNTSIDFVAARHDLNMELGRFANFYSRLSYGPFKVCYGDEIAGEFQCHPNTVEMILHSRFRAPRRGNSIWEVKSDHLQILYNLASPEQMQATVDIAMISSIIVLMVISGVFMSGSICEIALQPLERMMSLVRGSCAEIFKFTRELQLGEGESDLEDDGIDFNDKEHVSEFLLLEKAVAKLAAIAQVSATANEPDVTDEMNENELMVLNMMGRRDVTRRTMFGQTFAPAADDLDDDEEEGPDASSLKKTIPVAVLQSLDQPSFNSLDLSREVKVTVAAYSVLVYEGSANWVRTNVKDSQMWSFITAVERAYLPNPFHNFSHGLDVLNAVYRLLPLVGADRYLSEISQFWLLVAAIAHDVGHIGVNNRYLIETSHALALTYNDRSPLENMHCAKLFQVVNETDNNIFSQIDKDLYKEIRKGIIDAILHTDVVRHSEMLKELGLLYQMNSDAFSLPTQAAEILQSQANTQLIINALLHFADVNNPMRPWELCKRMAEACVDEFFAQGDLEKAAGIPVQMLNDRDKVNRPNSQIGFIEFAITPLVESMVSLFPLLDELANNLGQNISNWFDLWVEQTSPAAEAKDKVQGRVTKVVNRCQALMRGEGRKRESQMRRNSQLSSPQGRRVSGAPRRVSGNPRRVSGAP